MSQLLLFPDPRPLVDRLGPDFFRQAPTRPGVYLMRDPTGLVLYVGKAKNLRRRLASYRVANPDRLPRRHLRLLRSVARIEFEECPNEAAALARESELLLLLRPRFNRAGTWPGEQRYLAWRMTSTECQLAVLSSIEPSWFTHGPMGSGAFHIRASLARLLWSGLHPNNGFAALPAGWLRRIPEPAIVLPFPSDRCVESKPAELGLRALFAGDSSLLSAWMTERIPRSVHQFDQAIRASDLEVIRLFALKVEAGRDYVI